VLTFIFLHYFFWAAWIVVAAIVLVWLGVVSSATMGYVASIYFVQLLVYRPQVSRGWPWHTFSYAKWWDYILSYADATFVRTHELEKDGTYMFCFAPHGALAVCRGATCGSVWKQMFPGVHGRWASFGAAFFIPGVREFSLFSGAIDASKRVLKAALGRGESVFIIPGGSQELMLTDGKSTDTKLVLKNRKGFAKLAIESGVPIVPVFCFGEKWVHDLASPPEPIRSMFYNATKMVPMTIVGRWGTFQGRVLRADGVTPTSVGWVFGEPIKVTKMDPATADPAAFSTHLDEVHERYMRAQHAIFDEHKERFGYSKDETLTMVEAEGGKKGAGPTDSKKRK
jgi:hypothetical protein